MNAGFALFVVAALILSACAVAMLIAIGSLSTAWTAAGNATGDRFLRRAGNWTLFAAVVGLLGTPAAPFGPLCGALWGGSALLAARAEAKSSALGYGTPVVRRRLLHLLWVQAGCALVVSVSMLAALASMFQGGQRFDEGANLLYAQLYGMWGASLLIVAVLSALAAVQMRRLHQAQLEEPELELTGRA